MAAIPVLVGVLKGIFNNLKWVLAIIFNHAEARQLRKTYAIVA